MEHKWKKDMEPITPVHLSWVEITREKDVKWEQTDYDTCTSSAGGGTVGLSWKCNKSQDLHTV